MEVLRIGDYPKVTTWNVPDASTNYTIYVEDLVDHTLESSNVVSSSSSQVTYSITQDMALTDRSFFFQVLDEEENIVVESTLDLIRPYVDPNSLGSTASEVVEYTQLEMVARSLIDTVIAEGFYNKKSILQGTGQGSDYFSIWNKYNKILKVYENNVLVFDYDTPDENIYDFKITADNSGIQRTLSGEYNRVEQGALVLPPAYGDLGQVGTFKAVDFPRGFDYIFVMDYGYKEVPGDVEYATKLLIEDLKCGKLDYYNRYVKSYNTDQYKIEFDKRMFDGTGNMIVDKILDKYLNNIVRPGVV